MDLLKIRNWCFDNKILLYPDKTKLLIFGSRKNIVKVNDFHLSLLGKELVPATTAKDLRVILHSNLTFNDHVIQTVSSCMLCLAQINRVKNSFEKKSRSYYCVIYRLSKIQLVVYHQCCVLIG